MADTTFGPKGWTPHRLDSLAGKTYVITGGNAGIGKETAVALAGDGARVIFTSRNAARGADALAEVEPNDAPDAAQPVHAPGEMAGHLDKDWFSFTAEAARRAIEASA